MKKQTTFILGAILMAAVFLSSCNKAGSNKKIEAPQGWHLVWSDEFKGNKKGGI